MSTIDIGLRDYFAATASDGDIAAMEEFVPYTGGKVRITAGGEHETFEPPRQPTNLRQIARYMHADLMLKARQP